jgi:hypothetical protein
MASRKAWMKPNNEAVGDTNAAPRIIHGVSIFVVSNSTKHTSAIAIVNGRSGWRIACWCPFGQGDRQIDSPSAKPPGFVV